MRNNGLTSAFPCAVDAIIVPTARQGNPLGNAMRLAKQLGCNLVALRSGNADFTAVIDREGPYGNRTITIDFADTAPSCIPHWATSSLLTGTGFLPCTDTSLKRNVALLLAHQLGWTRIFFLDDDIAIETPDDIRQSAELLGIYDAIGLSIHGFPDSSVVGHAARRLGDRQGSFLGGGAIAVATDRVQSFFANIYNEDRLYLLNPDGLAQIALTGKAIQESFDPFHSPLRAKREEFGEVVVGGLYYLALAGWNIRAANTEYWRRYMDERATVLEDVLSRWQSAAGEPDEKQKIVRAIRAALDSLRSIAPDLCAAYVDAWRDDHARWRTHLLQFHKVQTLEEALERLSLRVSHRTGSLTHQ